MITDRDRPLRYLIFLLFIIYLIMIPVWVMFFKSETSIFFKQYWETKQFADTYMLDHFTEYANVNPLRIKVGDMVLNVIAFVPFGIYLDMLYHDHAVISKIMGMVFVSLMIEVFQFSLMFGSTDIVDLISNTLGGVIGLLIMRRIYSDKSVKIMLVIALVLTIVVALEIGIHTVNAYYSLADYYNSEQYELYLEKVQEMTGMS